MPQSVHHDLAYRRWWLGGGIALLAAVLILSLMPLSGVPVAKLFSDKAAHLLAYMTLMLWFGSVVRPGSRGWVFAGLLVYGGVIELLQSMTAYRAMEFADLVADAAGLLLGWLLVRRGLGRWCYWVEERLKD